MQEAREKQKEEEVLALKRSMEGGMVSFFYEMLLSPLRLIWLFTCTNLTVVMVQWQAQAMKEQARLKEEMVYLYKIGDMEVWYLSLSLHPQFQFLT